MKLPLSLSVTAAFISSAVAVAPTSYAAWMTDSMIRNGISKEYSYGNAVLYSGIRLTYDLTKNETLFTWYKNQVDSLISSSGTLNGWNPARYSLDDHRIGVNILDVWEASGRKEKFKTAATALRRQLDSFPRNQAGGYWHRSPVYPNQMWLDGLYMAQPFYAAYTKLFDASNNTAWSDIVLQFDLIEQHTRDQTSGLLKHGYDESKKAVWADPVTGACPLVWDRAVGWYSMALVDVLQIYPKSLPGYKKLLQYFVQLAAAIKKSQDKSGGWWLIMNEPYPGKEGNYIESSATAMFTYSLLKGIRTGLIPSAEYLSTAQKSYSTMLERFVKKEANGKLSWQGTVNVGSLGSNGTFEYYISVPIQVNDYKGAGPFIYASYEIELLAQGGI